MAHTFKKFPPPKADDTWLSKKNDISHLITNTMEPHTNLTNEITGAYYEEKYTWKDYLYIVPAVALLTALIIRSII